MFVLYRLYYIDLRSQKKCCYAMDWKRASVLSDICEGVAGWLNAYVRSDKAD